MADILFINAVTSLSVNMEVNGTLLLATKLLEADFDTDVLRFAEVGLKKDYHLFIRKFVDKILEFQPKAVSFYTLWPHYHIMLRIARVLKEERPDIITVFGGPNASATAEATMKAAPYIDYICTGEGENTVVPFFQCILRDNGANKASIPGLYYREGGEILHNTTELPLCDLNTLPHWDDRLYLKHYPLPDPNMAASNFYMPIDAGRGCPYNCTFCCSSYFWKRTYRLKSPERILEDILFYNKKFGIRSFWFSHDAFTTNRQLVADVCDHLIATDLDIRWKCSARIDCITEELILKMKQAGLTEIELGIETGSLKMQKLTNKNLNLERAKKMVAFMLEQKIYVSLFFMHGFPQENEQDLNETLELLFSLVDSGVQHVGMFFCRFNPTTALTEEYLDRLVLDPNIKALTRGIYGYEEEFQIIKENKAIFPYLYHLNTPERNTYQYLYLMVHVYRKFPKTARYLRKLYGGDHLKMYRDFYNNNLSCFEGDLMHAERFTETIPVQMLQNTLNGLDHPCVPQLKSLLKFEYDVLQVTRSEEDTMVLETYDFNYIDYRMNLPIEQYSQGKTEILIQKTNGKTAMKVLSIT